MSFDLVFQPIGNCRVVNSLYKQQSVSTITAEVISVCSMLFVTLHLAWSAE